MTTTLDIQRPLAELGYAPGPLDGIPGRLTLAAIKQFQRARNLDVDGIVSPITLAALFSPAIGSEPASLPVPPWVTMAPTTSHDDDDGVIPLSLTGRIKTDWKPSHPVDREARPAVSERAFCVFGAASAEGSGSV